MRQVAKQSGISAAYLPLVLSKKRNLSADVLIKLAPNLHLDAQEQKFLELLRILSDSDSTKARINAHEKMRLLKGYKDVNPGEIEAYHYLTHWYYVAVRELAQTEDFEADPKWIKNRLRHKVTLGEAKESLDFLLQNGYLKENEQGKISVTEKEVNCVGGVYKLALGKFHDEMMEVGLDLLREVPSSKRTIEGYTFAFPSDKFDEVSQILNQALDKIESLGREHKNGDTVYHVNAMAVPLTKTDSSEDS